MPDLTGDVYYAPAGGARPYEKGRVASDDGGAQVVVSRAAGEPLLHYAPEVDMVFNKAVFDAAAGSGDAPAADAP